MKTSTKAATSACDPMEEPIRHQMRRRLLTLNYHAFAQCLCLLLVRLGYEDVRVAGRTRWKGRNCEGGYDMEASLPAGGGRRRIIIQAKQFDALPVFQRSVDELRGTCLRAGASEALLITTSTFSPVVLRNAKLHPGTLGAQVAPVCLLDGEEVLELLVRHRVGIWEESGPSASQPRRLRLDDAFFEELSQTSSGKSYSSKPHCQTTAYSHGAHPCYPPPSNAYASNSGPAVPLTVSTEPAPLCNRPAPSWLLTIRLDLLASAGSGTPGRKGNE